MLAVTWKKVDVPEEDIYKFIEPEIYGLIPNDLESAEKALMHAVDELGDEYVAVAYELADGVEEVDESSYENSSYAVVSVEYDPIRDTYPTYYEDDLAAEFFEELRLW